ncbi:hypothetical protein CONLIGDRAFT_72689 [Coniochaeta ligniaria NRRL 30616]|uniref:Uncharacterized protein n=1 Tax=Coniochaeta ligniaria NRRL 30616 TaxID=1408157 RepID=A0A1J7IUR5_9PEZI|nr:hypothetical protein CONLIGDRAFT_72689 [Coniochaeta ligniaria NRRL 30616]
MWGRAWDPRARCNWSKLPASDVTARRTCTSTVLSQYLNLSFHTTKLVHCYNLLGHSEMADQNTPAAFAARRRIARQNVDKLGIRYEELPQLPFFAPLFGYSYAAYKLDIADVIVNTSALLGRGLTPEERDIIAYLSAKKTVTQSYEPPISLAAAIFLERRGRATSKFPFYQPTPTKFDPSFFPNRRMPMLQGVSALITWNAIRFGAYAFVAHFIGGIFFSSYATSVQTAAILRDPRLGDLRKGFADRRSGKRSGSSQGAPAWQTPEDPSMKDAETPYGGAAYEEESAPVRTGAPYDQTRTELPPRSGTTGTYPGSRGGYPPVPQSAPAASDEFTEGGFFEDDASPVAPAARAANASSNTGGSAWERLRQQAKSNPAGQSGSAKAPRTQSWGQQNAEQYTYSQEDADKTTAKDQAQREFDAMLEKERQGESDNQSRRW